MPPKKEKKRITRARLLDNLNLPVLPSTFAASREDFVNPNLPTGAAGCLRNTRIHLNGYFNNFSKEDIYDLIEEYGGTPIRGYSKSTRLTIMVYGSDCDEARNGAARNREIMVISHRDFFEMIEDTLRNEPSDEDEDEASPEDE